MLCAAISERRTLEFVYQGHRRIVIPAAHGVHATTGNPVLRAYQIGGTSASRAVPLWDLFRLDTIDGAVTFGAPFDLDPPGYSPNDKHIAPICCQL